MVEGSIFHRHRGCMEITLCVRGSAKFDCNKKVYTLLPGMVFVSMPRDVHRLRANLRGTRLFWLFLKLPPRGGAVLGLPLDESQHVIGRLKGLPAKAFAAPPGAKSAFEALFAAYDIPAAERVRRAFRLRSALISLFTDLISGAWAGSGRRGSSDRAITSLIERMRRMPEEAYGIDRLVEATFLSPNTILSRFRRYTGLPPHAFLMKCRIRRSMELLAQGFSSVDVAARLSFASSQHFSTRFKQETGRSPQTWCRENRVHQNAK